MSMHAIESLVEYSVIAVATASPVPPTAQRLRVHGLASSCRTGKIGYLSLLSPEQLPEPERSEH